MMQLQVQTQSLNGLWQMNKVGESKVYDAHVPTTMYEVLLKNSAIEDPFYGENDVQLTKLSDDDYEFSRLISINEEQYAYEAIEIEFEGLDTLATIYINDKPVKSTNNMHRRYRFDIKSYLVVGENNIRVCFESPTKYIEAVNKKEPIWGIETTMDGYEYLRKAHHMFGWDWGPQLPDMGIWRDVMLHFVGSACLEDCYIEQKHEKDKVTLSLQVSAKALEGASLDISLKDPSGAEVYNGQASLMTEYEKSKNLSIIYNQLSSLYTLTFIVDKPMLWWPNGYGDPNLYDLNIALKAEDTDEVFDKMNKKIGLRTLTVTREKDSHGESFDFTINDVRIFAMGADYIPEDALISRTTRKETERLIKDCVRANYNCLRVWGGGVYPNDTFLDLCDAYGLIVWEDFMFACGVYRLSEPFVENIKEEFIDNIRRIRHHACLGLWCGNNEMEWGFVEWDMPKTDQMKLEYLRLYEQIIPDVLSKYDPTAFYWPASPSSGGGFDKPNDDSRGDVHYWNIFHGNEHYKRFRDHYFRFASEYGMQAFPHMKTIKSYSEPSDCNVFSPVMENHNKCVNEMNGNVKILTNMSLEYKYPNKFEDQVYVSQVFQGETIKCAVEHFRRNRGRCMGSTYWQVNDNYPVASWSSIDYYGRWKALHYYAKRFYNPVLVSGYEDGLKGHIHITNDQMTSFDGSLKWQIHHVEKGLLKSGEEVVSIEALSAKKIKELSIKPYVKDFKEERLIYIAYQLIDLKDEVVSGDTLVMTKKKEFTLKNPTIDYKVDFDHQSITLSTDTYAPSVEIDFDHLEAVLTDNYFDLVPGQDVTVKVLEWRSEAPSNLETMTQEVRIKSLGSIAYL